LLIAGAIAVRTGTTDIRLLGGLITRAPRMATGFLLLSAAAVGFPGTLGFVSEDLLVQGLLRTHSLVAAGLLIVTALNSILLYRAFKRTFLGPPSPHAQLLSGMEDFLPRESWVWVLLIGTLLLGGFAPAPLLAVRQGVVSALHIGESTIPGAH
jgi:NADH-quinone oxidoreductase subunit M